MKKNFEYYLITLLFIFLIIVSLLQVLFRFVLNMPLAWTEEASRYIFIILIYLGASAAALEDKHVRVEIIDNFLSEKNRDCLKFIIRIIAGIICFIISLNFIGMIKNSFNVNQLSAALRFPIGFLYLIISILFLIIMIRFFQKSYQELKKGGE